MKKTLFLISFFFLTSQIFALGAGIQISAKPGISFPLSENTSNPDFIMGENITGTFRTERFPAVYAVGFDFEETKNEFLFGLNLTFDYWIFEKQLINIMNCYGGTGVTADFRLGENQMLNLDAGLRAFLGLNWHFFDGFMEYYLQIAAAPVFATNLKTGSSAINLFFPVESGLRLHF